MAFVKISEQELGAVGVELLDDQPALQPDAMKAKFEETAKQLLAPKINTLVEQLEAETGAASLGAAVPDGLNEGTGKTVQAVMAAQMAYIQAHEQRRDNPHGVTAAQTGAYTKAETDRLIDEKVADIGSADMNKATYDPQNKEQDIFAYADQKMSPATYDPKGRKTDVFAYAGAVAPLYTATYLLDGWVATSKNGYNWQQTVTLAPDGNEAPAMNADSVFLTVGGFLPTGVASTDDALADSMACINAGYTTCGNGTVTTLVVDKPDTDISVRWSIRPKGIGSGGDAGGGSGGGIHIDDIYPVGSIYMNVNATSPSTLFGGTWERINGGFLVAADSNHPAGSTGGRSAVTLTAQNIPQMTGYLGYSDGGYVPRNGEARSVIKHQDNGGDAIDGTDRSGYLSDRVPDGYYGSPLVRMGTASPSSISIEPPYLAVYMWRRTA